MSIRVHVRGQVRPPEEAVISVFDRGFLYGDSVYETLATTGGRVFALSEHLDRLERSAAGLDLRLPPRAHIADAIAETLAAASNPESRVRVMVTRGDGAGDLAPQSAGSPELVVIVMPLGGPTPDMYARGVSVEIVSITRNDPRAVDPSVKSGNYLNNVMALGEARRRSNAHEAILCASNGSVAEGATSNVFMVTGGEVLTPALPVGILEGITRAKVLGLCQSGGIAAREVPFMSPEELRGADEVFLTSSVRGVLPVTSVDGKSLGRGEPGPVTRTLMESYRRLLAESAAAEPQQDRGRSS